MNAHRPRKRFGQHFLRDPGIIEAIVQAIDPQPGDTIVVPMDAERMRPLPLWQAVTTIIFNLAVAVAAVNSF